jgi:ubiquitin C-terminal hydrolase
MSGGGLANLGSTCAINSLIQILYRTPKINNIIMNSNTTDGTITYELKDLFNVLNQNQNITPNRFIHNFYIIFKGIFNFGEQIDICELFLFLIEKIHDETSYNIENIDEYYKNISIFNKNKYSDIYKNLQGSYINTIECLGCGFCNKTYEPFIYIGLDICENLSISELLNKKFIAEIRNADEWKCEKCLNNCNYKKKLDIYKYPEILFISLNRFNEYNKKNNDSVNINPSLTFNPSFTFNPSLTFNLQAIGLHYGLIDGGHYNSICITNKEYVLYDDTSVCKLTDDIIPNILSKSSYILCYN